jgi:3-deoxy-D-manno-octulosonate 8-phosphate phosphatase KdsC-like HAD superfamily phosphatase
VRCIHAVDDKSATLRRLAADLEIPLRDWLYVGNDLNDIPAMRACGFSACPSDAHPLAMKTATTILKSGGGDRVVLEVLESLMRVKTEKYFR